MTILKLFWNFCIFWYLFVISFSKWNKFNKVTWKGFYHISTNFDDTLLFYMQNTWYRWKDIFLSTSPCFIDSHVTWIYYQYQPFFVNMVVDEFFIWWTLPNFIMSLYAFNCENNFHKFYVDPIIMAFHYNVFKKIPWANGNQSHEKIYVHD